MSIVALALAAGLAPAALGDHFTVPGHDQALQSRRTTPCPALGLRLVPTKDARPALRGGPAKVTRLRDLPKANKTLTVLRSFDGCAISSTVAFDVEGDGHAPPKSAE
jgi:hypothetical protein